MKIQKIALLTGLLICLGLVLLVPRGGNLKTDLLTPTDSALPFMCTEVTSASSTNAGGNSPGNLSYGISLWYGVGSITTSPHLGPTGEELGHLNDSNVFDQRYVGTTSDVFGVGAADNITEQVLTVTCDTGTIDVYTPEISNVSGNMRLYVAQDGSTYYSRASNSYTSWPSGPDLTYQEALVPEHLAKASPTYQADCYNYSTVTYGDWACDGTAGKTRLKTTTGKSYNSSTAACDLDATDATWETETCDTGETCSAGVCAAPLSYTVDDDYTASTAGYGVTTFSTIQSAVDAVPDDSTVHVNPGIYYENVLIEKNLTLEGESAAEVVIDGGALDTVLYVRGANNTISGLTIRNSGQGDSTPGNVGIHVNPIPGNYGTFTIKDNIIYGNRNGLSLWNGFYGTITVQNNMIFHNTYVGIDNGFGETYFLNNTISDNGTRGYTDWLGKGPHTFTNNIIVNNGTYGIYSHEDSYPRYIDYNTIWNNTEGNYYFSEPIEPFAVGEIQADPLFVDRTNGDYNISSSSPCQGTGQGGVDMGANLTMGTINTDLLINQEEDPEETPEPNAVTEGLIGHWKFNGDNSNEISGSPDALAINSASFESSGGKLDGYAYIPTSNDSIEIPYDSMFDLNEFTIEFWFQQRSDQSFLQALVYKGYGRNYYNFYIFRQLWNQYNFGPIITGYTSATTGYWTQTSNGNQLAHNEWHHVAYVKDDERVAYYLDGEPISFGRAAEGSTLVPAVTPATNIIIGDSAVDTDIDNLRIYNQALTTEEVRGNGGFATGASEITITPSTETPVAGLSFDLNISVSDTDGINDIYWRLPDEDFSNDFSDSRKGSCQYNETTCEYAAPVTIIGSGYYDFEVKVVDANWDETLAETTVMVSNCSSDANCGGAQWSGATTCASYNGANWIYQSSIDMVCSSGICLESATIDPSPKTECANYCQVDSTTNEAECVNLLGTGTSASSTTTTETTIGTGTSASSTTTTETTIGTGTSASSTTTTETTIGTGTSASSSTTTTAGTTTGTTSGTTTSGTTTTTTTGTTTGTTSGTTTSGTTTTTPTTTTTTTTPTTTTTTTTTTPTTGTPTYVPVTAPAETTECGDECDDLYDAYGEDVASQIEHMIDEKIIEEIVQEITAAVMEDVVRYITYDVVEDLVEHFDMLGEEREHILEHNNEVFEQVTAVKLEEIDETLKEQAEELEELKAEFERGVAVPDVELATEIANTWNEVNIIITSGSASKGELETAIAQLEGLREEAEVSKLENGFGYHDVPFIFDEEYDPSVHWYGEHVIDVTQEGFASGYKDEEGKPTYEFGPGNSLLRAEVTKVSLLLYEHDVSETSQGAWYEPFVDEATSLDMSIAYQDPTEPVTRGEMMNLIYELGLEANVMEEPEAFVSYLDVTEHDQYRKAFQTLYEAGIIEGQSGLYADLGGTLNRAEMAKIIHVTKEWIKAQEEQTSLQKAGLADYFKKILGKF